MYSCEECNYHTPYISNYYKHAKTSKHLRNIQTDIQGFLNKLRKVNNKLRKENIELMEEYNKLRKENNKLRKEDIELMEEYNKLSNRLQIQELKHESEIQELKHEFTKKLTEKEMEIKMLTNLVSEERDFYAI